MRGDFWQRIERKAPPPSLMGTAAGCPRTPRLRRTRQQVVAMAQERYGGINYTHLAELLAEREGVMLSRSTVRRLLVGAAPLRVGTPPTTSAPLAPAPADAAGRGAPADRRQPA